MAFRRKEYELENHANTLQYLGLSSSQSSPFIKGILGNVFHRKSSISKVLTLNNGKIVGLVTAVAQPDSYFWNVTNLNLKNGLEEVTPNLLTSVLHGIGHQRGRRTFLRLRQADPLSELVKKAGFFRVNSETLFKKQNELLGGAIAASSTEVKLLRRTQQHDHDVFRLFNATTPLSVRLSIAMTISEFLEYERLTPGDKSDWILTKKHLGLAHAGGNVTKQGLFLDGASTEACLPLLQNLFTYIITRNRQHKIIYSMIPEYNTSLRQVLCGLGFEALGNYETYVHSATVRSNIYVKDNWLTESV